MHETVFFRVTLHFSRSVGARGSEIRHTIGEIIEKNFFVKVSNGFCGIDKRKVPFTIFVRCTLHSRISPSAMNRKDSCYLPLNMILTAQKAKTV